MAGKKLFSGTKTLAFHYLLSYTRSKNFIAFLPGTKPSESPGRFLLVALVMTADSSYSSDTAGGFVDDGSDAFDSAVDDTDDAASSSFRWIAVLTSLSWA